MRSFIDIISQAMLVEANPPHHVQYVTADDIRHAAEFPVTEHGNAFLNDDLNEFGVEELVEWANSFAASFGLKIEVYRGLSCDPEYIRWNDVGVSWSPDFHHAINEHGPDGGYGRSKTPTSLVLKGEVDHESVDWLATFCILREDSEEPELRLREGSEIRISAIMVLDTTHDASNDYITPDHTRVIPIQKISHA